MDGVTPLGQTEVVVKRVDPSWIPTPNIRKRHPEYPAVVPPGPDNPLGNLALYLGWPSYLIHGTNRPLSIGRRLTSGCIRLYPEHIEILFGMVKIDTPVTVVDQPVKVGWLDGELYLQVFPTQSQAEEIEVTGRFTPGPADDLAWRIASQAGDAASRIDWPLVTRTAAQRTGIAVRITKDSGTSRYVAAGPP
jgi:L,D-transpeptidase ErfK/SrfK